MLAHTESWIAPCCDGREMGLKVINHRFEEVLNSSDYLIVKELAGGRQHPCFSCCWALVVPAPVQHKITQTLTPLRLFSCAFPALFLRGPASRPLHWSDCDTWQPFVSFMRDQIPLVTNVRLETRVLHWQDPTHWTESPMQYYPANNRRAACPQHWDDKLWR